MRTRFCSVSRLFSSAFLVMFAANCYASPVVDGMVGVGEYGSPLAVQDTPTGFGDTDGVTQFGSELNAVYANFLSSGEIQLMFTGNLEDLSGNGLVLFLDLRAGGAVDQVLPDGSGRLGSMGGRYSDDWGTDVDGGPGMTTPALVGSVLAPGFDPDISIEINAGGGSNEYFVNIIDLTLENDNVTNPDVDRFLGGNILDGSPATQVYFRNDFDIGKGDGGSITHAFDNSNTAGVTDSDASSPLSATKGMELLLSSEFLQIDPGHCVQMMPFISNPGGDFLSNQFLPGLDGAGNLGGGNGMPLFDSRDFSSSEPISIVPEHSSDFDVDGDVDGADFLVWQRDRSVGSLTSWQSSYGTIAPLSSSQAGVPEPSTLALVALGLLGVGWRRCSH